MKIISLKANNILRIKALHIEAGGKSVKLSGKNGSGKTSAMRCIEMALRGADAIAEKPIHGDEEDARIILDLGEFKVARTFHKTDNKTTLTVTSTEGAKYPKPQAILDGLCSRLSFDPLEFARLGTKEPEKQRKTLMSLVGLDFSDINAKRQQVFDERTMTGRDLKLAEAKTIGKKPFEGLPAEPVRVADLMKELEAARQHNQAIDTAAQSLRNDQEALQGDRDKLAEAKKEITELESRLSALKQSMATMVDLGKKKVVELDKRQKDLDAMVGMDTAPISGKITNSETTNADIRFNQQYAIDAAKVEDHKAKHAAQTKQIEEFDAEKQRQLLEAKFPLKGLGFTDTGVTLDGIPFAQCSTGDQIRASAAIGMALNPKLRVLLIRDASLLDKEGLEILAQMAHENDVQLWLEEVGDSEEVAVTIEGEGSPK